MNEPMPRQPRPKQTRKTDWSGANIGLACLTVMLFFDHRGDDDIGLAAFIALGMILIAVRVEWALRKHAWFWATVFLVVGLNIPLALLIRWPNGPKPVAVLLPVGVADVLVTLGGVSAMENLMTRRKE